MFFNELLKKKGENLATHEDLNKVVEQMSAVTAATKKIEADISSGVWDKQKRWEMKREVLFEATKRLGASDHALQDLNNILICERNWKPGELEWTEAKLKAEQKWSAAANDLDDSRLFVATVCSKEAREALDEFGRFTNLLVVGLKSDPDAYKKAEADVSTRLFKARAAIRKELEVDA